MLSADASHTDPPHADECRTVAQEVFCSGFALYYDTRELVSWSDYALQVLPDYSLYRAGFDQISDWYRRTVQATTGQGTTPLAGDQLRTCWAIYAVLQHFNGPGV